MLPFLGQKCSKLKKAAPSDVPDQLGLQHIFCEGLFRFLKIAVLSSQTHHVVPKMELRECLWYKPPARTLDRQNWTFQRELTAYSQISEENLLGVPRNRSETISRTPCRFLRICLFQVAAFFNLLPFPPKNGKRAATSDILNPPFCFPQKGSKVLKGSNFRHSQLAVFVVPKRQQVRKGSNFRPSQLAAFLVLKDSNLNRQLVQTFTTCCFFWAKKAAS